LSQSKYGFLIDPHYWHSHDYSRHNIVDRVSIQYAFYLKQLSYAATKRAISGIIYI
jgi:hypothetical protein